MIIYQECVKERLRDLININDFTLTVIFVWRRVCAQTEVKCFLRWSAYAGESESTDNYDINYVQYKTKVNENVNLLLPCKIS